MDIHPLGYAVKQATLSNKPLPFSLVFSNSKDPRKTIFYRPFISFESSITLESEQEKISTPLPPRLNALLPTSLTPFSRNFK